MYPEGFEPTPATPRQVNHRKALAKGYFTKCDTGKGKRSNKVVVKWIRKDHLA